MIQDRFDTIFNSLLIGFFIGGLIGIGIASWILGPIPAGYYREQAVIRGFAHMVIIDTLSGKTEFQWKDGK